MVKRESRKKRETSRDERRGVGEKKSGRSRKRKNPDINRGRHKRRGKCKTKHLTVD